MSKKGFQKGGGIEGEEGEMPKWGRIKEINQTLKTNIRKRIEKE